MDSDFHAAQQRIAAVYDPELLRSAGHKLIDQLANHLRGVEACEGVVLPWREPEENLAKAARYLEQAENASTDSQQVVTRFAELVRVVLQHGHNLHDPRYLGHQVPASIPMASLFEAVGSTTNQPMAVYEMGPWANAVESAMISVLGCAIGWQEGAFSGLVTNGGSLANMTALLTARNVMLADSWESGLASGKRANPPVLVVHSDAHYSVGRSAGILGIGTQQVVRVGLDARRRMDPNQLEETLRSLRANNTDIVAVVACACSTPIGAFDPLPEIAEICRRYDVWLHVDAAHGGSACVSPRYRHLVDGLASADSLIWDAHKMLFMPALCAFAFFRDKSHRFEAFRQEAPYLFDALDPGRAEFDSGLRTLECTKRAAILGLWGVWSVYGPRLFADMVNVTFAMGRIFYEKLLAADDFVPLHEPECNIVVFRYVPKELEEASPKTLGRFQMTLWRYVIESGDFFIVSTKLDGVGALRVTIINPLTTPDHLDQLLETLRRHGRALLERGHEKRER